MGSVVQYYRGESAAMLLEGYDNTKELPNEPHLVQNPPFSSNVSLDAWKCFDETIGDSIPLMQGEELPKWVIKVCVAAACVALLISAGALYLCIYFKRQRRQLRKAASNVSS